MDSAVTEVANDEEEEFDEDDEGLFVRLIILQFSFSNWDAVPESIHQVPDETDEEFSSRHERKLLATEAPNEPILGPVENCSLEGFIPDIVGSGYELVGAFVKGRKKDTGDYPMVRFTFAYHLYATPSEDFLLTRKQNFEDLLDMVQENFWRTRIFSNLFYQEQQIVDGHFTLSVNLEARVPRYNTAGDLILTWKKDVEGEKVGDTKLPLGPDFHLRTDENGPVLLSAD